ncbi:endonuclease/exonuclease/phosphatase family protein [Sphaerisporangium sp. NPDC005289]|uniref:endonuclease/exonuclease/phosphatase family protein n=1 Tax=Sphaerisporangium sp. NPDC005289 TaxID=3155247 RepID=UPI0033A3F6EC
MSGNLTVLSLNLEAGGWDDHHWRRPRLNMLPDLVGQVPGGVDVLMFQEGKEYGFHGQHLRFHAERLLAPFGLRSFMTRSVRGELHELLFVRWPRLQPLCHYTPDLPGVFHDQVGWLRFHVEGLGSVLAVRSVQWASWNGDIRLDEAQKLTRYAAPGVAAIIGGDFNSLWPDCPGHKEFEPDWEALPPHKRTHKTLAPGLRPDGRLLSDRRALTVLAEAGFVNAGCLAGDPTPTVHSDVDHGQGSRIDHILFSPLLAPAVIPNSYRVWANDLGEKISDHRMVSVRVDLTRLSKPDRLPP